MRLRQINVVAAAIQRSSDQRYLLARRKKTEKGAGKWEFPGGKIEPNETELQALTREIFEELSIDLSEKQIQFIGRNAYNYPEVRVDLSLWRVLLDEVPPIKLIDHDEMQWFAVSEIPVVELSSADIYFLPFL